MNIVTITEPLFHPCNLAECYSHLRMDPDDSPPTHPDDDMLTRHIASATRFAEKFTRRAFVSQSLRLYGPAFTPTGINLLRPPIRSVESVQYYDTSNVLQTLDSANWYVTDDLMPQVRFVTGFAAPAVYDRPDAVRVNFTAGYDPESSPPTTQADYAANVPSEIKDAILLGVELLYEALSPEQRERLERARESLLIPYRIMLTP